MRRAWLALPLVALGATAASCPAPETWAAGDWGAKRLALAGQATQVMTCVAGSIALEAAAAAPGPRRGATAARTGGPGRDRAGATGPAQPEDADDEAPSDWGVDAEAVDPLAAPEAEPAPEAAPPVDTRVPAVDDPSARLASIARETWIYAEPKKKSRRIGYLRAGAVVPRSLEPVGGSSCKGGWYAVAPRGYVCAERTATLDVFDPIVEASQKRPRLDGLPYDYVLSRNPTPALYAKLPSEDDVRRVEPDRGYHDRKLRTLAKDPAFVPLPEAGAMPPGLLYGQALPGLTDDKPRSGEVHLGQARLRSGFALLAQFDHDGRRYGMTTDLALVPLDRTRWVKPTSFHGLKLDGELTLPVAFVMKKKATRWVTEEASPRRKAGEPLGFREAVALTGRSEGGFLEAKDGTWVRAEDVRVIEPMQRPPGWAGGERRWIDVSILRQSLVAYEGQKPVYVTLVSTGADGLGDPKETHSTIQGTFLVHTKHVTVTMDGDDAGDEFDLRDVPFVQYFTQGYALHAAYWHDDFGTPRSHGCINLAPDDAAWLFGWTTPDVPEGWHASLSLKHGTLVHTHP